MDSSANPRQIAPVFVERVWGRTNLAPLYGTFDETIGEVWFPIESDFPLLIKFIFTDQKLSVQVHPDDDYARQHEDSRGKTEMWHILDASPGACVALGFSGEFTAAETRSAISDGTVEQKLEWVPVAPGDTLFTPAGVVHAIGAGIVLCEIQQNSDVTYRLYDYGRPRQLHLDKGLEVSRFGPHDGRRQFPVACPHFVTESIEGGAVPPPLDCENLLITLAGFGSIGGQPFQPGQVWFVPKGVDPDLRLDPDARLLRARAGGI